MATQLKTIFSYLLAIIAVVLVVTCTTIAGIRRMRVRRCDAPHLVRRQQQCVVDELKQFKNQFVYIRAMKDAIDRCTYLFYTSVQVPYTIVLYRANTELVFVLRPVKVLESCESILMSPRPPNFELTNRTLDILGTDFCDQQAIQTNISLLNFDQKQKTTNTLIYKPAFPDPPHIIDHISMEGENVEFQLPYLFYKHGVLRRRNGVVACQLHINFSNKFIDSNKMFHIVQQLALFSTFVLTRVEYFNEHQMAYFLNFDDLECRKRYLTPC